MNMNMANTAQKKVMLQNLHYKLIFFCENAFQNWILEKKNVS